MSWVGVETPASRALCPVTVHGCIIHVRICSSVYRVLSRCGQVEVLAEQHQVNPSLYMGEMGGCVLCVGGGGGVPL